MQAAHIQPPSGPSGFHLSDPPPAPPFDQHDMASASASASTSTSQPAQASNNAQNHPMYPSLHYPPNHPSGQYPNGNWMYQQEYHHPQQPFPPQGRAYLNGNGHGNNYNRNDQYSNHYTPQPYHAPYYNPGYPQLGGPGPATMQNGYPYQEGGYSRQPHAAQPPFEMPPPQPTQQPSILDGNDSSHPSQQLPPPNDGAFSHPHQPPPQFQSDLYGGQQYPPYPSQQPPFQTFYPPNHPYAYGGGVGYQQFPPAAPAGYADHYPYDRPPHVKGLNPAAQGFTFLPQNHNRPDQVNGTRTPQPKSAQPVFASVSRDPAPAANVPNGHIENQYTMPVIVDGEKLKGIGGARKESESDNTALGLGLTQMNGHVEPASTSAFMTASTSTPAMTASPTTSATPISVLTPKVEADHTSITSPKTQPDAPNLADASTSGQTSPGSASRQTPSARSELASASTSTSQSRRSTFPDLNDLPIKLHSFRPDAEAHGDNAYASGLSSQIPDKKKTEMHGEGAGPKLSKKGKGKASGKRVVFAAGTGEERRAEGSLVFGEVINEPSTPTIAEPEVAAPVTPSRSMAPPAIPKVKPASWAALLRDPSRQTSTPSETLSVGPSSVIASPSKSVISLWTEDDAGPSTPKSTAVSLPPSTVASTTSARPAFNYAAAAAAGKALTPQEDLAKLLTDGVKGPSRSAIPASVPRGLINTGNMCFANTILQVLVYCPPFTELLEELGKRLKADLARRTPLLEAMIIFLREFSPAFAPSTAGTARVDPGPANGTHTPRSKSRDLRDSRNVAFVPENVYDAMKENKRFDSMRRGFQEDAEEYLGFFINTLHEELLAILSRIQPAKPKPNGLANGDSPGSPDDSTQIRRPVSPDDGWLEVGKKQKTHVVRSTENRESAITRIFGGTLRSVLHTPGQKDSVTLEPYQPLQLDIQASSVLTISDALRHISEPEIVPGVWSSARNTNVDATKQVYIDSFPPVLILHLKRFVYDPEEQNVVKRSKLVGYGTELVVPPEIVSPGRRGQAIKYRLFGVVYHHGISASGGHYTVAVCRQDTKQWLHFDDELVTTIPAEQVVVSPEEVEAGRAGLVGGREKCAYLLFYQRVRA